jgi:hypothetical protein
MLVRVIATSSDLASTDLGEAQGTEAVAMFRRHPWRDECVLRDRREAAGKDGFAPSLKFEALPWHMSVAAADTEATFDVDVCLPRSWKVLGLFAFPKFYRFSAVSASSATEMISVFCGDHLGTKHSWFKAAALRSLR